MKPAESRSNSLKEIEFEHNETIVYQGAPNLRQSMWHCYRVLFNFTFFVFLLGLASAFFFYNLSLSWLPVALSIYMVALFLLSLIDAYTDRDVYYCITDQRVLKLKAGKLQKQLRMEEITKIIHKETDGQGFFLFTGAKAGSGELNAISVLGIDRVKTIYAALPARLKEIADASNKSMFQ